MGKGDTWKHEGHIIKHLMCGAKKSVGFVIEDMLSAGQCPHKLHFKASPHEEQCGFRWGTVTVTSIKAAMQTGLKGWVGE